MEYRPENNQQKDLSSEEFRCVLRSLESVTGVSATTEEEELRRDQLVKHKKKFTLRPDENPSLELIIKASQAERDNIRNIIAQISKTNSPLGRALRQFSIDEDDIYPKRADELLRQGDNLILYTSGHVAHIGVNSPPDKFISLSDGGKKITLKPWQIIHVLRLTRLP